MSGLRRRASLSRAAVLAGVLVATALAAGAGWLFGSVLRGDHNGTPSPVAQRAAVGPVRLQLDGDWVPSAAGRDVAGAGLDDLRAFAPARGLPARVWIARAPASNPALVPAALTTRLAGRLGVPRRTTLAGAPAWSYAAVRLARGGSLELTVQPTSAGVLLVGCQASETWWNTVAGCADGVLVADGARPLAPAADLAYRLHAHATLTRLDARRAHGGRALRRARSGRGQARIARRLAAAHAAAAASLRPLAPHHGAPQRVIAALRRSRAAYAAVARAAHRGSRRRYATARRRAARSDAALRRALRRGATG
jgi:hypothetical protein